MASGGRRWLFLDLDGTLADSVPALRSVYDCFLRQYGVIGSESEFTALNGPPLPAVVDRLKASHGLPGDAAVLLQEYRSMARAALETAAVAPGGAALLAAARALGWGTALVTATATDEASRWLSRNDLQSVVEFVVGGDCWPRGKPDPGLYQLALARAQAEPNAVTAVEDSRNGLLAALAAGISVWSVGNTDAAVGLPVAGRLASLADLTAILGRLNDGTPLSPEADQ
jgi:HAD superfamily hydrolase (TIGR01509 family)